ERAATARAVGDDLREAEDALERSAWPPARAAIDRAKARLGGRGRADLRRRLDRAARGLDLAARLDDIQTRCAASAGLTVDDGFDSAQADRDYETAFREAGLGAVGDPAREVAERVRATGVRRAVVEALDHWSTCAADSGADTRRAAWVLAV